MIHLPPGPNPRSQRPYVFVGDYFGEPVPGAIVKPGRVVTAVDAAWIFAQSMGCVRGPTIASFGWGGEAQVLFDYQRLGATFLATADFALLADEMGLGKTVQALKAAEWRLANAQGSGPAVLILCPAIAKRHWQREVKRWTGHDAEILDGVRADTVPTARYVIANYDILYGIRRRDSAGKLETKTGLSGWKEVLTCLRFPIVICDEAHMLRGQASNRTKAVKEVAKFSTCVWLLTGTPMPNHVRDIWSLWDLASGGLAGYYWPWAKAYAGAVKSQYGWSADGKSREDELSKRLSFWCLGRTKAGVGLQLPEKRREVAQVDVETGKSYTVDSTASKGNQIETALRATARLKRPAVVEMVNEALAAKQKIVVFTYLREQCTLIAKDVAGSGTVFAVNGDQTSEQRDILAQAFRETDGAACFVATIDSVGVAISLVGADLVVFADLSYDPSKLLQAEARCHRIGSQHPVLVRYVIAAGTLDEAVAEMVVEKLETITAAMGGMGDGAELTKHLRRGEAVSADSIVDRLFARLTGG